MLNGFMLIYAYTSTLMAGGPRANSQVAVNLAPYTADIDIAILIGAILIALFSIFILWKKHRRNKM